MRHAGIDPSHCHNSVECAISRKLEGCYKAEGFLRQLYKQVEAGILKPTRITYPYAGPFGDSDKEIYISKYDAERWRPEGASIQPAKSKTRSPDTPDELIGKSKISYQELINGFYEYVFQNETGQPKPKHFKNRKIILKNGRLSVEALADLLKELYPNTPKSANRMINDAIELKTKKLDN